MGKNILLGLSMVLLLIVRANAEEMLFHPDIPDREELIYREMKDGEDSWGTFTDIVRKAQEQGKNVYMINSLGENKINMVLKTSDMKPIMVDSTYKYKEGIFRFKKDYRKKEVHIVGYETKLDKTIKIPKNIYDEDSLFYVLRGLPFKINKKVTFNIFYAEPDEIGVVGVYAKVVSKENIIVPAGEFTCYKIEIGLTGIESLFYKEKYYFWFNTQNPHYLIKYSSTEGELIELINYSLK